MSLADWLRGWRAQAAVASSPSAFDELSAEPDRPKPGEQRLIAAEEMTDADWRLAQFREPSQQRLPLFNPAADPNSFPMP